jgi:hypothetical protein
MDDQITTTIRMNTGLHTWLRRTALEQGDSMNSFMVFILEERRARSELRSKSAHHTDNRLSGTTLKEATP